MPFSDRLHKNLKHKQTEQYFVGMPPHTLKEHFHGKYKTRKTGKFLDRKILRFFLLTTQNFNASQRDFKLCSPTEWKKFKIFQHFAAGNAKNLFFQLDVMQRDIRGRSYIMYKFKMISG